MKFSYSFTSPAAIRYAAWLDQKQRADKRKHKFFSLLSLLFFVLGFGIPAGGIYVFNISVYFWGICPIFLIVAGLLLTDDIRGNIYFDFVGATIYQFSTMNEFAIGKFEHRSMMMRHDVEEQKLLFCLRISSNVKKYKKPDVLISHWKGCLKHGAPYFFSTPRGGLAYDFLSQLYFQRMQQVLQEYAQQQYTAIANLKTETAKQNRLKKAKSKLVEILTQNHEFPQMQELVNATYRAIAKAVNA